MFTRRARPCLALGPALGLALAAAVSSGCARPITSVTHLWKAEQSVPIRSVVVFGAKLDESSRRAVEDGLAAELSRRGVQARAGYTVFPTLPPDAEQARALVDAEHFDGILVATMKGVRDRQSYVPGGYHGGFWSAYPVWGWSGRSGSSFVHHPGTLATEEEVSFETTLWDTRSDDRLVWAALTRTTNPSAGAGFVESLTGTVVPALLRAGLLSAPRE